MVSKLKNILKMNYQQILLVFLAFLIMVLVSYFYVSNIVRGQIETIGTEVMNTTQTAVSGALNETELVFANFVQSTSSMLISGSDNQEVLGYLQQMHLYFSTHKDSLPDYLKVYAYLRGEFLDGSNWTPPADYEPATRPWYLGAATNGGGIFFSDPYLDADTGDICISFSQALYDANGDLAGVLAIDLDLSRIIAYVDHQSIANQGYGILLSDSLQIATHKNSALIGQNMDTVSEEYLRLANLLLAGGDVTAERFTDDAGVDSVAFFRPVFNQWYIGMVAPRNSYYASVYNMGVVLAALGLVLMLLLSSLLVRTRMEKLRADEESRSKSHFLARMSHEMRTPMNAIIGMTEIAKGTNDPEKVQYSLGKISDAAEHLLGVINDVLDMSKIEANKLELSPAPFSLRIMLKKSLNVMELKMQEENQTLCATVDEDVPDVVKLDEQRLKQVLLNLLSNANKFTAEGGQIGLQVACLSRTEDHCVLQFRVEDNGIGLSAEQIARLFKSFEQADNTISRRFGGSGLGLSISKQIVEMMGGTISVESELGVGSVFTFTVQAAMGSAADIEAVNQPESVDLTGCFAGKTILLAEDVPLNHEIIASLLEPTQVEIDWVENGELAVEAFSRSPARYDMIFMDIHMPALDGYEATKQIRALEQLGGDAVPIIAMTADVFLEDIQLAKQAGMNGHVGKPIDLDAVIAIMRTHLDAPPA